MPGSKVRRKFISMSSIEPSLGFMPRWQASGFCIRQRFVSFAREVLAMLFTIDLETYDKLSAKLQDPQPQSSIIRPHRG